MLEYVLGLVAGGIAVSAFAALGDTLRPKSFLSGVRRGRDAAALDAAGAALGSLGLAALTAVIWLMVDSSPPWAVVFATVAWLTVAVLAWLSRRWL